MFFKWSKFSKVASDYINERISLGKPIEYKKYKVPKVGWMTGNDLKKPVKGRDDQFSLYCLKWPHVRYFGKPYHEYLFFPCIILINASYFFYLNDY